MTKPSRASIRIASGIIKKKAQHARKKTEVSKLLKRGNVWSAVRSMYRPNNVWTAREGVSSYFYPIPQRYNSTLNTIYRNGRVVNKSIKKSIKNKSISNMMLPLTGKGASGAGVSLNYVKNAFKNANMRYATVGRNRKLKAFALLKVPAQNTRYINVISGFPGYGSALMNKILQNAKNNGKKYVTLKAVTNATNNARAENYPLVKWYKSKGFVRNGTLNSNSLLPMRYTVT